MAKSYSLGQIFNRTEGGFRSGIRSALLFLPTDVVKASLVNLQTKPGCACVRKVHNKLPSKHVMARVSQCWCTYPLFENNNNWRTFSAYLLLHIPILWYPANAMINALLLAYQLSPISVANCQKKFNVKVSARYGSSIHRRFEPKGVTTLTNSPLTDKIPRDPVLIGNVFCAGNDRHSMPCPYMSNRS